MRPVSGALNLSPTALANCDCTTLISHVLSSSSGISIPCREQNLNIFHNQSIRMSRNFRGTKFYEMFAVPVHER